MPIPDISDIEPVYIKIYMLTKLTPEEEKTYLAAITAPLEEDVDDSWVRPSLVPWPCDTDGSVETDLLRLYKQRTTPNPEDDNCVRPFCFFADRQSVEEGGTILVDRDLYTLRISKEASERHSALADEAGIELPARDWSRMLALMERVSEEMLGWGVAWGREPGACWRPSWMNLDISNMMMRELVEFHGGEVKILRDPEWDSGPFVRKLKVELEKMKEEGLEKKKD
ncbi:hypothetical protein CkaCkLH20_04327 [Colletotrichum karsti]|uniref:Uncharacterized protein n=1 Tax=Colletotrichum karsti TaxID=1095194 RepID=A0A9P6I974_9PEZI|nr:uncharacterized protein CkaCkLH20_04327 [Colletotrichum karsti]KAF9878289.1 hypothetical protein CkaCkLH20_04327 [Colletotrichum karsti]